MTKKKRSAAKKSKSETPFQRSIRLGFWFSLALIFIMCCGAYLLANPGAASQPTARPATPTFVTEVTFTPSIAVTLTETSLYNPLSDDAITSTTIADHDLTMTQFSLPDTATPSLYNPLSDDAITPTTISDHDLTMTQFSLPDTATPSFTIAPKPRTRVPVTLPPTLPGLQSTVPPKPTTAPISTTAPKPTSAGVTCPSLSYKCPQLTCAQAYACLAAGNKSLDRDGDGKPCETQCNAH